MRALLALVLSLILALASQTEAVARSEMVGSSDLILCAGTGTTTLTLDASGHPVHARACTHCLAAGMVADLMARTDAVAPTTRTSSVSLPPPLAQASHTTITPTARAPPAVLA